MAAQCLGALAGLHRQKMRQHAGGDTKGHEGGKMSSQLIQPRRRPTMRWPADTSLGATTAGAAKPREPHRHRAEQRRDLMKPPVLDVTSPAAGRAVRPQCRVIVGLRGYHRLLHARQDLLCLGQRQPQIRNVAKVVGPADLHHVDTAGPVVSSRFDQLQNPPHPRSPSRQRPDRSYRFRAHTPSFWTLPRRCSITSGRFASRACIRSSTASFSIRDTERKLLFVHRERMGHSRHACLLA